MIVHVPEPEPKLRADVYEVATRQPRDHVALRSDHPAEGSHVALLREDLADERRRRVREDLVLERVDPFSELLHLRPVVVDDGVDDAMEERDGPVAED